MAECIRPQGRIVFIDDPVNSLDLTVFKFKSIPLISVLAPANHHDSHFMWPLIDLGKAIGGLRVITAAAAYHFKKV